MKRIFAFCLIIITLTIGGCDDRKTIHCKDGTTSSGTHTQGKCSHHGGIA